VALLTIEMKANRAAPGARCYSCPTKQPKVNIMNAIVIEHVKVAELPEAWRSKIAKPGNAHVTVRIEYEATVQTANELDAGGDLLFGMWRDREEMANVESYIRKLRAPRYNLRESGNKDQGKD
jgi:hypothetical protein